MKMQEYKFQLLGMYTNSQTCISVLDDFGNLVRVTVDQWNSVYNLFLSDVPKYHSVSPFAYLND